jgi:prepilin-type N-terminal cleavage/methylation domain-containing protein
MGFSLIEMLVVVAILGLISIILTVAIAGTLKRQRLETAGHQLKSFVDRAYALTAQQASDVFVQIGPAQADGSRTLTLVADTNSNQTLDGGDPVLATETITGDLILTNSTTAATQWPTVGSNLQLLCNIRGQAINPVTKKVMTDEAIVSLTHSEMTGSGTLRPRFRFDVHVFPLWNPTLVKVRY